MSAVCDRCKRVPVIFIRYSGQHLCGDHFVDLIRRRFGKEARSQGLIKDRSRIGVALSGGKDSILVLKLLHDLAGKIRGKEIVAITIDEGIGGYRETSVDIGKKYTEEIGVEWTLLNFRELFGMALDDMVKSSELGPCTICGTLRRQALNRAAKSSGSDILVTGHNLDDMAQTVLMNVLSADVQRFARMGPHGRTVPGFIPRAMPLRTTPETETYLTATLLGLPLHELECPYAEAAHRGTFRDIIMMAERETPGTRHSLLRFHEHLARYVPTGDAVSNECPRCSEPVSKNDEGNLCKACSLLDQLGVG
ncbi:MAG: ATP-binding protein [Thermoplasmatota archaeon]